MDDLKEKKKTHTSGNEVAAKKMVVVNGTAVGNNWEGEMAKIKVKRVSWALHESLGGMGCMSIFVLLYSANTLFWPLNKRTKLD